MISFILIAFIACNDGIDPISEVDPGADQTAPQVDITFPLEGTVLQVLEVVTTINVKFEATDDIELKSVDVTLDGEEIASFSEFKDYRRFLADFDYDNVTDGTHVLTVTATDIEGKSTSASVNFEKEPPYVQKYEGEVLYMPFDNDFIDLVSITRPTVVGSPGFAGDSQVGLNAYQGAEGAYLTMPTENIVNNELSAVFWMKVNDSPDRAGVLVIGPEDPNNPSAQNNRTNGFRFFRENAGGMQRFKLNVGRGDGDSWFDGGMMADVAPNTGEWTHLAFTISDTKAVVYINGEIASEGEFTGVDWTGCDILSIMSGAPRFTGWSHLSDQSQMDELRIFNRELSQSDIQNIIFDESNMGGYTPLYDGEIFYAPFDNNYIDFISRTPLMEVGSPGISGNAFLGGGAFEGAADSYLTFPARGLMNEEFSAVFWMNVNDMPDRAGVMVIGPPDPDNPDAMNKRTNGFRFFRENAGGMQRYKLNVGKGDGDSWFDGGTNADVAPNTGNWTHFAFTISNSNASVYINGEVAASGDFTGVDWTDCDMLSIMSGAPRFTGWGHLSDQSLLDELRLFDKALSQAEIQGIIMDEGGMMGYQPKYDGEVFYAPFDGDYTEMVSGGPLTEVGTPGFAGESVQGADAYAGAADSYLTFPTDGLTGEAFSAVFWMKINAEPDRAGVLVMGPPDPDNPDAMNKRTSGFRFFRENADGNQRFKLNVGKGEGESWFDGGANADVDPSTGNWTHFAFTISGTESVVYINGEIAAQGDFEGVDWTDCDILSIMSGAPRFTGWGHNADASYMDELRLFNKALTQDEINTIISDEM